MIKKLFLPLFLLAIFSIATKAQINPEKSVLTARDQFSDIKNRSTELERMKRESRRKTGKKDYTLEFPLIKEDFEEIQKITDDILRLSGTANRQAIIFKLVSEINERAVRLKSHLFTDESDAKKEAKNKRQFVERKDINTLCAALDESVSKFAHNPIFQNINVVNSKDSFQAQRDLETVINVSGELKLLTKN